MTDDEKELLEEIEKADNSVNSENFQKNMYDFLNEKINEIINSPDCPEELKEKFIKKINNNN